MRGLKMRLYGVTLSSVVSVVCAKTLTPSFGDFHPHWNSVAVGVNSLSTLLEEMVSRVGSRTEI